MQFFKIGLDLIEILTPEVNMFLSRSHLDFFPEIEKISLMKKGPTSMVKSQPILKNNMRSGTAKEFSAI